MKLSAPLKKWLVPLLLIWVAGMSLYQAYTQTLTSDEAIHTASAYLGMTRGEYRFDPEHPFLFKDLTGLPFLLYKTNLPRDDQQLWEEARPLFFDSWRQSRQWATDWVYESGNNPKVMQVLMRIPGILVLVTLNWFVFWLARKWYGEKVGLWALFFTAFNATLLGHGFMTNTDVPLALTYLLSIWRLGEYGQAPTRKNAVWAGVAIAAALLTKFSAIAIIPAAGIWLLIIAFQKRLRWYTVLVDTGIVLGIFVAFCWVLYFFKSPIFIRPNDVVGAQDAVLSLYGKHINAQAIINIVPHILPSTYLKGLIMVLQGGENGRPVFLLAHTYGSGVWFYFPILVLLKTQLVALALGGISLGFAFTNLFKRQKWDTLTWLWVICGGVFLALAVKSKLNLGIRHISPLMPIFSIILAVVMVRISGLYRKPYVLVLIIVAYVLPILTQRNSLLGFGNILTAPSEDRYHFFVDSNLDWGQSWERIANVVKREFPNQPLYVVYSTSEMSYFAPTNKQLDINHAGSGDPGAILIAATDLNNDFTHYQQYKPAFIVDNAYFIYRSDKLVPR